MTRIPLHAKRESVRRLALLTACVVRNHRWFFGGVLSGHPVRTPGGPEPLFMSGATVATDGPFAALWCLWPLLLVVINRTYLPC